MIDVNKIKTLFGDRVLVKRLNKPEKVRGLYVPDAYAKLKKTSQVVWWGEIMAFGLDSRASEEHGLSVGDIVGLEPAGAHYAEFTGSDNQLYTWVPEEHLALADMGSVKKWCKGELDARSVPEIRTLGARLLVRPEKAKDERNGIVLAVEEKSKAVEAEVLQTGPGNIDREGMTMGYNRPDVGTRALVAVDGAWVVDLFEPALAVLRAEDVMAEVASV
jgi:co-chaperonin GroES (HSP10)